MEQHLQGLPGVEDVGVIPVSDPKHDEEIKAIIVREAGSELTAAEIVAWCREGLAPFRVPRYIEFRDELPYWQRQGRQIRTQGRRALQRQRIDTLEQRATNEG